MTEEQQRGARVQVRRIYDDDTGGHRVLVDRLWPRGLSKVEASFDEWLKDVAPSTELRRWYGHEPDRFGEFERRYRAELESPPASEALAHLASLARSGRVVLLTATRDVEHSAAAVLHTILTAG